MRTFRRASGGLSDEGADVLADAGGDFDIEARLRRYIEELSSGVGGAGIAPVEFPTHLLLRASEVASRFQAVPGNRIDCCFNAAGNYLEVKAAAFVRHRL